MKEQTDKFFVVIPALNEDSRIGKVVDDLIRLGFHNIVVVDDGSTDSTSDVISEKDGVFVLKHLVNMGPGASTMTGIQFALQKGADYIATIDADQQHDPKDLLNLSKEIRSKEVGLMIGSRFKQANQIPISRQIYNFIANIVSYYKTGILVSDSQSGLKVLSRKFAELLSIDYNGFEFCIDIIKKAKLYGMEIAEVPINVQYSKETMAKGQNLHQGMMMLARLLNPFA